MPEQDVVEIRQQPDGHGDLGIGTRRTRQIEELGALLVAEDLQAWSHPFENVTHGEPGPCPHVGGRGGPERGEVTAREILDRKRGTGLLSEPRRKGGQRDEASSSPDATRRSEDEGLHVANAVGHSRSVVLGKSLGEELGQLRDRARPLGHDLASGATDGRHVRVPHIAAPRAAAHVAALTERHEDRLQTQCVARRDEMDGVAHEGDADRLPVLDQARQLRMAETLQPRPEADVRQVRGLGLHADQVLDRGRGGGAPAFSKELAGEQRAVQRAPADDLGTLMHRNIFRPTGLQAGLELGLLADLAHLVDPLPQVLAALFAPVRIEEVSRRGGKAHPHHQAGQPESHEHHLENGFRSGNT